MIRRTQCSICRRSDRVAIDRELVEGISAREIAHRHSLSKSAVGRHAMNHIVDHGSDDDGLDELLGSAQKVLRRAEARGDHKGALEALRLLSELRKRKSPSRPQENREIDIRVIKDEPKKPVPLNGEEPKRNVTAVVKALHEIYGISYETRENRERSHLLGSLRWLIEESTEARPGEREAGKRLRSLLNEPRDDDADAESEDNCDQEPAEQDDAEPTE